MGQISSIFNEMFQTNFKRKMATEDYKWGSDGQDQYGTGNSAKDHGEEARSF